MKMVEDADDEFAIIRRVETQVAVGAARVVIVRELIPLGIVKGDH
jgi:hypothetical protein